MTRSEVADYLREFAAQLDTGVAGTGHATYDETAQDDSRITFMVGDDSQTIDPPKTVRFEVAIDSDSSLVGNEVEHEVAFELGWTAERTDDEEQDALEIK